MTTVFIDTESFSKVPISAGTDAYTRAAECTAVTFAVSDGVAQIWERGNYQLKGQSPYDLRRYVDDAESLFVAHNSSHDRWTLKRAFGLDIPIERWRCTRAQAYSHALPGSLDLLAKVLGVPADMQKHDGDALIDLFCIPQRDGSRATAATHPEQWEKFCAYAKNDVVALREVYRRLPTHNYRDTNLRAWFVDQKINDRGILLDEQLAKAAVAAVELNKAAQADRMQEAMGADHRLKKGTQTKKLLTHLQSLGVDIENLRADTIHALREHGGLSDEVEELLDIRQNSAGTASSKYKTGLADRSPDGRIRHTTTFGAALSGRHNGKGFQPLNMFRPRLKAKVIEGEIIPAILDGTIHEKAHKWGGVQAAVANAVRGSIIAEPGSELIAADWTAVEPRTAAWLAGDDEQTETFRQFDQGVGVDNYKFTYAGMFGMKPEDVDGDGRQMGKVVRLAFNYLGGVGSLVNMAKLYKLDLNGIVPHVLPTAEAEMLSKARKAAWRAFLEGRDYELERDTYTACDILKQRFRIANKKICDAGYGIGNAVTAALRCADVTHPVCDGKVLVWATKSNTLIIQLPSGRRLYFWDARLKSEEVVDPQTGKKKNREYMTFMCNDKGQWKRERSWAGQLWNQVVQGSANDVERFAMVDVDEEKPGVLDFAVHDELILEDDIGATSLEWLQAKMTKGWDWSRGLPLACSGWVGSRYKKE